MKKKYQNAFLIFGLIVLALMVSQLDFQEVWQGIQRAGYWFLAVVLLWAVLYVFNTAAWWIIIKSGRKSKAEGDASQPEGDGFSFLWLYKITVSGFALNYATPGGLMGGEPYRIMELTPFVGKAKAASSVILYAMMHIFSHFWFWLFGVVVFFVRYGHEMTWPLAVMFSLVCLFCLLAIYFFLNGYRNGLAMRTLRILSHLPFVGHRCGSHGGRSRWQADRKGTRART